MLEELVHLDEERRRDGRTAAPGLPGATPAGASRPRAGQRLRPAARVLLAVAGIGLAALAFIYLRARGPRWPAPTLAVNARVGTPATSQPGGSVAGAGLVPITLGMASPLNGANKELGLGFKAGIEAALEEANDAGGVHGRRLSLVALDDGNEPARTVEAVHELLDAQGVSAIFGEASSMSAELTPLVSAKKVPWLGTSAAGPGPGAPPEPYLFGLGPGLTEETAAAVRFLFEVRHVEAGQMAFFGEDDDLGEAGFAGVAQQLRAYGQDPGRVLRTRYRRNSADVEQATERLRASQKLRAIVMMATHGPAGRLIQRMAESNPAIWFTDVSFVDLGQLAEDSSGGKTPPQVGILVTQRVPLATSSAAPIGQYRAALAKYALGERPGSFSLEGWMLGKLLVEALRAAGPAQDSQALLSALEGLKLDLGLGAPLGFSAKDHLASHAILGRDARCLGLLETGRASLNQGLASPALSPLLTGRREAGAEGRGRLSSTLARSWLTGLEESGQGATGVARSLFSFVRLAPPS